MAAEVGLAAFSSIVSEGAKSMFKPIIRQISYVFKYQSYIDKLKDQVKQLGYKRERVEIPAGLASQQGDETYTDVTDWLTSVDAFSGVAKPIIDDEDGAKKSCFKGLCPNLLSRYKLGKQAAKAAEDAANLVEKGISIIMSNVSHRPAPKRAEHMQVKDYEAFDSRMKVFQDVVEALKDDKFNIIGVYGMGGVGKTTLVKQVAKQMMEYELFKKVVMAEVTQNPDHQKIQDKLASDLGMKFASNDSIHDRANQLCQRLKKEERLLIILDNIWTKLELAEVGIPSGDVDEKDRNDDQRRCTIILTSRSRDLLCNDMNSQKNFPIDALSKEEALHLFEKIVGDSTKISAFQPIADEIVERCGGLPIALSTVANALKSKSLSIWKDALNQLRSSDAREIHGMDADVYSSIKLSYDFLESAEAKYLFLLCGLHREGHPVQVDYLLRYGMGLDLFKKIYTLEAARNRVDALIDNLKASCLLLDGDAEDEVKMHDVIHNVAVSICTEKLMFNVPNVADFEKEIEETIQKGPIAISLPHRDIEELPERLQCPNLQLFLLFTKDDSSVQISDVFFEGTEELRVLDFTGIRFSSLPSSLGCLTNVQTLCLDCCNLEDIAVIGQLKKLEILSFRGSNIKQLPLEIGQLTRLELLDLSNCTSLEVIAPNVISKLSRLEELYMLDSFTSWENVEGGSNASLAELKGLSKLTTLEIHVPDAETLPQDLVSVELQRYRLFIGSLRTWLRTYETVRSRFLELLRLDKSILLGNYAMKMLLKGTEDLYLEEQKGVQNVVHELDDGEGFPQLKHLDVSRSDEILHIVGSVGRVYCKVFPLLESLSLYNLSNLKTICDRQLTEDQSFSNLRIIRVLKCNKLKHLFSFSMAKNLLRLQKLEVHQCDELEMIVGPDMEKPTTTLEFKEITAQEDPIQKVTFPNLEELDLRYLSNIEKLWPDQFQGMYCCQNLTKVTVESCGRLKYLFSYSMVNSLVQLQHLDIKDCESMEGVVDTTGLGRDEGKLIELKVFPKLHYLGLSDLPNIRSFANMGHIHSDNSVVEFPSLQILKIHGCSNMLRFISTSSSADYMDIETQPQPLFDEKVRLSNLERIRIYYMDKLRKIWHHQLASDSFSKLKNLQIGNCDNLMNIFPPMVGIPSSLVNLEVSYCEKIEEIIGHAGEEVKENRITFSELNILKLDDLPRLTSFCLEDYTLEFPSLERVSVIRCQNMKTFSHGVLSTPKLYKVQVTKKEEDESSHSETQETEKEEDELYYWEGNLNFTIQKCYEEMVGFRGITELTLSHFPHLREIELPVSFFNNLEGLLVDDCTNMSSAIPANLLWCLNNLQYLEVRNCDPLEEVLHLQELVNVDEEHFGQLCPKLKSLHLIDLPKLQRFCNFIENGNSTSVLHMTADNMKPQEITSEENFLLADHIQPLFNEKVAFPKLTCLKLSRLPKVLLLWKENSESNKVLPNLLILEISECSKLQKLLPSSWHLENLMTLKVSKCHGLINVLTLSTSESLVNLITMMIADCKMMEEIIQSQVGEEAKDCIVFRKLKYLEIDCLPILTSFCWGNCALQFPSLEQVVVRQCPKMKFFSQGVVDTPKLNKVKLTEEDDDDDEGCWEGNLNDTIQKLFNEMISEDKIEPILLVQ